MVQKIQIAIPVSCRDLNKKETDTHELSPKKWAAVGALRGSGTPPA